jgi:hypothetical protein
MYAAACLHGGGIDSISLSLAKRHPTQLAAGGRARSTAAGEAYGENVALNFPELKLHQDAALVAQLCGVEAVADGRALITAWVAANSAALRRRIHPASLRGVPKPAKTRARPRPDPAGSDDCGADEEEMSASDAPEEPRPLRQRVAPPAPAPAAAAPSLRDLVQAARQATGQSTTITDDGTVGRKVVSGHMTQGICLGVAVRALLGGGDPGALRPGGAIQVLHGAGHSEEIRLSAGISVALQCQGEPPAGQMRLQGAAVVCKHAALQQHLSARCSP